MGKKISKEEFDIRTLAFYQAQGGILSDLITVMMRLRGKSRYRGMLPPAKALNETCYQLEIYKSEGVESAMKVDNLLVMNLMLVLSVFYSFDDLQEALQKKVLNDTLYRPEFMNLITNIELERSKPSDMEFLLLKKEKEALMTKVAVKDEIIQGHELIMAQQSDLINSLQKELLEMHKRCAIAEESKYKGSAFDRLLTLDTILQWIEGRHHYNYTEQVFRMLADLKDKVATDEERAKIAEVENRMLDKNQVQAVFNQNFAMNSNMMTGMVSSPQLPIGVSPQDFSQLFQQFLNQMNNGKQQ